MPSRAATSMIEINASETRNIFFTPPPPQWGGLDLDSRSSGCARLGGEVGPPLGVVVEEVAVLVVSFLMPSRVRHRVTRRKEMCKKHEVRKRRKEARRNEEKGKVEGGRRKKGNGRGGSFLKMGSDPTRAKPPTPGSFLPTRPIFHHERRGPIFSPRGPKPPHFALSASSYRAPNRPVLAKHWPRTAHSANTRSSSHRTLQQHPRCSRACNRQEAGRRKQRLCDSAASWL